MAMQHQTPEMALIERLYAVRGPAAVAAWLEAHPYLVPLLCEARDQIDAAFGPHTHVALEVIEDAEVEDDRKLWALIAVESAAEEADDRFDRLLEQWWLDALPRAQGQLALDVDFE